MPEVGHAPHSSTTEAMARGQIRALWLLVLKEVSLLYSNVPMMLSVYARRRHKLL